MSNLAPVAIGPAPPNWNQYLAPPGLFVSGGLLYHIPQGGLEGAIDTVAKPAGQVLLKAFDVVSGGLGSAIVNTQQALASGKGDIVSTIVNGVNAVANSFGSSLSGIGNDLANSLGISTNALSDAGGDILGALGSNIGVTKQSLLDITNGITKLLGNSFAPLNKLVDEFASQPAQQLLGIKLQLDGQTKIANEIYTPAMKSSIQDPLTKIHATLDAYQKLPNVTLQDPQQVTIQDNTDAKLIFSDIMALLDYYKKEGGFIGTAIASLMDVGKIISIVPAYIGAEIEEVKQYALAQHPATRIDIGNAISANIKGILSDDQFFAEMLSYGLNNDRAQILRELAQPFLGVADSVKSLQLGIIDEQTFVTELTKQGYNDSHIQAIKELASFLPNANDALSLYYRGLIDEKALNEILAGNGYSQDDIKIAKDSGLSPLSPQGYTNILDRIAARDKGFMQASFQQDPPKELGEVYKQNRLDTKQAQIDWLAHWKDLPANDWITAFFRGFINEEQMRLALSSQSIPAEAVDLLLQLQRPQLSIRYISELLQTGGLSTEQAKAYLRSQGYDDITTDLIIKYVDAKIYGHLAETTNSMLQLSIGQLAEMFADKVIDSNQYKAALIDHKYTPEAADYLVHLKEVQLELAERKEVANEIMAQVKLGNIDIDTAVSQLHDAGFSQAEVGKYQSEILKARAANTKLPSEGQLATLLKKGKIGESLYIKQMMSLGYSTLWASLLYEIESGKEVLDASLRNTISEVTGRDSEGGITPKASAALITTELGTPKAQKPAITS